MKNIKNPFIILLGRPGCGKSAVFKILTEKFKDKGIACEFERIDDFPILKELLNMDVEGKRHEKKDGGFAVTDWTIIDEVLQVINKRVLKKATETRIIFIEFARASYTRALKNFSQDFLNNSVILYIKADFQTCLQRNEERFLRAEGKDLDSHIVPPDLMKSYYKDDDIEDLLETKGEEYIRKNMHEKVFILDNNEKGLDRLESKLDHFVEFYVKGTKNL